MIRLDKVKYDPSGMQLIYSSEKVRALNMATFFFGAFPIPHAFSCRAFPSAYAILYARDLIKF